MNQPTHEEIWVWVTQHPDYERAKHVCPQCHADCTGHKKVQALVDCNNCFRSNST